MTETKTQSSRRAFFLSGGAALGAGVATTVGAAALTSHDATPMEEQLKQLRQQLEAVADREAVLQLQLSFATLLESQAYEAAAALFDERAQLRLSGVSANGKAAILKLFANQYREQKAAAIHSAFRQNTSQQSEAVTLSEDRLKAAAIFQVEAELCTPLQADCTVAQMARLQGHVADRRWERGRLKAEYVKTRGGWKIASLIYLSA